MDLSGEARISEPTLIDRARRGDGAAWEALVRQHQEPIFRFAYLLLSDPDEAEDTAQETFIRAYRALGGFDTERPLRPWLLSIAANLARNRRRSMGRYLAALQRFWRADPGSAVSIEEKSSQRWESQTLWQAVQRLSQADQQVIYLRYFLDMSIEEVAGTLHVARGTVKSRLHRALSRLKGVIARDFPGLWETEATQAGLEEGKRK